MPVAIITGFLGAGKTTLLNELLSRNQDADILIIENEAGDINIDGSLLEKANKNNVFELSSGCICCSLNAELGHLLSSIIRSNVKYDYVLVEATGMADPGEVIRTFTGAYIQRFFKLDAVIGLVDAGLILGQIDAFVEIRRQLAQSDIVLINKTDLITTDKAKDIEHQIHTINPFARIEKTMYGNVQEIEVLHSGVFDPSKIEKSISGFSNLTIADPENKSRHDIKALSFTIPGDFKMDSFSWWLDSFIFYNANNILRIKGILSLENMQHKIVLQSVGNNYQVLQGTAWQEEEVRASRLVFIGSNLDQKELEKNLLQLRAENKEKKMV